MPALARRSFATVLLLTISTMLGGCASNQAAHAVQAAIDARFERAARDGFSGVLAVDSPHAMQIRAIARSGGSDSEGNAPLRGDTVFRLASITKQFTAVLVLQAVATGRFELDTTVATLWPDAPVANADRITVRHLLTHLSGLPDPEANGPMLDERLAACDHAARVASLPRTPAAAPGERFAYNNADYWLLGALLERVHGRDYASLLQRDVFDAAGMASAGLYTTADAPPASHARGHVGSERTAEPKLLLAAYGAAGAAFGTAGDLLRFDRALRSGRLLPEAAWRQMITANEQGAALGVWCYELAIGGEKVQVVERQGWIGGVKVLNLVSPSHDLAVVVLADDDQQRLDATWSGEGLGADLLRSALAAR